jgi:Fic family protein
LDIFEQLGEAKAAIARLQGRSAAIPNQGMLINTISLQEAKASSEIENIFTTDDELYKAFSDETSSRAQQRKSCITGNPYGKDQYLESNPQFDIPISN